MTEQTHPRDTVLDAPIERLVSAADPGPRCPSTPGPSTPCPSTPAPREALDREESGTASLRIGALVEAAICEASRALMSHDAALALDVIKDRGPRPVSETPIWVGQGIHLFIPPARRERSGRVQAATI